ncbi:hypothetical protein V1478_001651 [Vespula squamosa]|uniref:Uncharacterized protein n=1 Tax=Vespula squamosa TaxID=30214 RepID=A0ABD2C232_VESSQ
MQIIIGTGTSYRRSIKNLFAFAWFVLEEHYFTIVKTMMAYLKVVRTFKYVSLGSEVLQFSSFVQHDMGMSGEFTENQSI